MQMEDNQNHAEEDGQGWGAFGEKLVRVFLFVLMLLGLLWFAVAVGLPWAMSRVGCC